jgi:hypothetical protein
MLWVQRFWLKLQTLFGRNRSAERLDDEIQFHLEQQIAENVAAGMNPEEARHAAMRALVWRPPWEQRVSNSRQH